MLEVKNINCGYGSLQILWDVSLNVSEGEIVCILGQMVLEKQHC